jgi:hypothetical protein
MSTEVCIIGFDFMLIENFIVYAFEWKTLKHMILIKNINLSIRLIVLRINA